MSLLALICSGLWIDPAHHGELWSINASDTVAFVVRETDGRGAQSALVRDGVGGVNTWKSQFYFEPDMWTFRRNGNALRLEISRYGDCGNLTIGYCVRETRQLSPLIGGCQ